MLQPRKHIVLVPGFGGFDALGQISYYAGTTDVFQRWRSAPRESHTQERDSATLHYFDNAPSASVAARAARLQRYLSSRMLRNEFQAQDRIALVGHSTGGLDIRRMVSDLQREPEQVIAVDAACTREICARDLLQLIERVVFISTPHAGTNLADFVDRLGWVNRLALRTVKLGMTLTRALPALASQRALDRVADALHLLGWDLDALLALLDAYREVDEDVFAKTSADAANAREAHAQLELWLDHMVANFQIIKDLKTQADVLTTRAHCQSGWPSHIQTRSYATIGAPPTDRSSDTDLIYRLSHHVSRRGRFRASVKTPAGLRWLGRQGPLPQLTEACNDGIVNTLSMFFSGGGETFLVAADHGDVIGHYQRVRRRRPGTAGRPSLDLEDRPGRRRYGSYDFFRSGSGFGGGLFDCLWTSIFEFCTLGEVRDDAERGATLAN